MAKYRLMMLGPPGAGKGTQAKNLAEALQIPHISTGDMLRDARRKGTELGKKAEEYMNAGALVPDEVVIGIVHERLQEDDAEKGFILDGFPRTLPQAEALGEMGVELDRVLNIVVSDDEVVSRLSGRLSCPNCGAVYHRDANPPAKEDVCDNCGHQGLVQREDDRPEVVKARLTTYHKQTAPLVEYYRTKGVLRDIAGTGEPDAITAAIIDAVNNDE